jgi:triacylglycerol esterase/lipase EstA (alpha/beta hydrolase family)
LSVVSDFATLIMPGFCWIAENRKQLSISQIMLPTVILPGYLESSVAYQPLAEVLTQKGSPTTIVPMRFKDWVPTIGGRSMVPILRLLHQTVITVLAEQGVNKINLIGHSAGGWIARMYLGELPYTIHHDVSADAGFWNAHRQIATLISLGTPQFSGEKWTKKNLNFVNDNYPGAFYPEVNYVCVAGKSVYGERKWGNLLAYQSYQLTCGTGNTWGDGIIPIEAAHLDGAKNLVIENVKHSPRSADPWYGSPAALAEWQQYLA